MSPFRLQNADAWCSESPPRLEGNADDVWPPLLLHD